MYDTSSVGVRHSSVSSSAQGTVLIGGRSTHRFVPIMLSGSRGCRRADRGVSFDSPCLQSLTLCQTKVTCTRLAAERERRDGGIGGLLESQSETLTDAMRSDVLTFLGNAQNASIRFLHLFASLCTKALAQVEQLRGI